MNNKSALVGLFSVVFSVSNFSHSLEFDAGVNVELFSSHYDVQEASPFNPDNLLANFPDDEVNLQLRPKFSAYAGDFSLNLSPRLGVLSTYGDNEKTDDYSYVQEWSLAYNWSGNMSASVGRELIFWGGSQFTSPSNPFYISNNQSNPFIEPKARDFVQLQWYGDSGWDIQLLANYDEGEDQLNYAEFKPIYAIKNTYTGSNFTASLVLSTRDESTQVGYFGQWTANDATLVYLDASYRNNNQMLYADSTADNALGWQFKQKNEPEHQSEALLGVGYTFESGSTVNLEYRYYESGYNDVETDQYYSLVDTSASAFLSGQGELIPLSASLLSQAAYPFLRSINQNYLYLQYFHRDIVENLSVNFLVSHNIDDGSTQLTPVLNYYASDNIRISGNFNFGFGDEYGEYSKYLNHVFYLGLKYYF